ncbi:CaiB/BaiF CoA-transferase family protein [Variovorax sp. YR216]|uniref:CaiB/BaiF CoA transferase family protein n=1 Tax=Variovorax sp. YR216 TaxID=1882828 RepID=UPI00089AB9C3|nr:CoA transferase [Variovorax sp. YR216]SEB04589.1 succinyl-CoA---D-citramalate CoA-transferase [Variovorax sp. YR216]
MTSLAGLRVLDLSRFIAGPYCAMILGDMGAEVVKIEPPGEGEYARRAVPGINGQSLYTFIVNRNKKSLAIDLRSGSGLKVLRELIARADVLVENFRPGTMEKMGLGWDAVHALNPRLVMARISGFGQDGPLASKQCFDGVAQAMSGLMDMTGPEDGAPTMIGSFMCDYTTGMYAALGILSALNARHASGKGQLVDVSLLESAVSMLMTAIPQQKLFGTTMTRVGSRDRFVAPSNTFATRDGRYVLIVGGDDNMFPRTVRAMKQPALLDDPRFATMASRLAHREAVEGAVADWMLSLDADEIVSRLEAEGVPCAKIATVDEVVANPQLHHRGAIADIPFGDVTVPVQGVTIHLSDTPLSIRRALPQVGEHNAEVLLQWLGYEGSQIAALESEGAL